MFVVNELPPQAYEGEMVGLDVEIFGMDKGKLHRDGGTFACLSVFLERDLDDPKVYQIYDPHDICAVLERVELGKWVLTNAQFDIRQMRRWADIQPRRIWDTMLVEQELFGGYYTHFNLQAQANRWLHEEVDKETRDTFSEATEMTPQMKMYAALDPYLSVRIAMKQIDYLIETDEPFDFYWQADAPMIWVVLDMKPARIDVERWGDLATQMESKADSIGSTLPFNPGSWQQVKRFLEDATHYKLSSTDAEHLEELKAALSEKPDRWSGPISVIDNILEYRAMKKAAGTYGKNWIEQHVENGNEVWTSWKICGATDTSRMSSETPNLQNIPARKMPVFREMFIPSPGNIHVVADVAQQEPRILAKLSNDPVLKAALKAGESPHITTGRMIFDDPNFSKADARYIIAKSINLGMPYGMSAHAVANKAGIPLEDADRHLRTYFRKFGGVRSYMDQYRSYATRHGYVRNALGRRCWVNPYSYQMDNNAINAPIQSTAGHQIKIASAFLHRESRREGLPFCLSMLVHDEMVNDVPPEIKEKYKTLIIEAWNEAGRLTLGDEIPMAVEFGEGTSWACKH